MDTTSSHLDKMSDNESRATPNTVLKFPILDQQRPSISTQTEAALGLENKETQAEVEPEEKPEEEPEPPVVIETECRETQVLHIHTVF